MERSLATGKPARDPVEAYAAWFARLRAAMERNPDMPLEQVRAILEGWGNHTAEPSNVDYAAVDAGGVRALWAVPHVCAPDRVLICSHGGGYSCGSMHSHRKLYGHLAKAIGCRSLILNYRRVPEHPHPAAVEDVFAAYRWLLRTGRLAPEKLVFAGDSAGGALAVTAMLVARREGEPLPAAGIALSPWVDLRATGASYEDNAAHDAINSRRLVLAMGEVVLEAGGDARDPLLSPLIADFTGLPPLYLQVGGHEALLDDSRRLVAAARTAGIAAELDIVEAMQHCFQMLAGNAPQADAALTRIAGWVRPKLGLA